MKRISNTSLLLAALLFLLTAGCHHAHDEAGGHSHGGHEHAEMTDDHDDHSDHDDHGDHEEGSHLTAAQMETMDITFGPITALKINDYISATGTLGLPPNAYVSLNAKAAGFVRGSSYYVEGNFVRKGVVMAWIENADFIDLQREYLESKARMTFLEQEARRQQTLADADAGVERDLQRNRADLEVVTASVHALARKLEYIGISSEKVTPGNITDRIALVSPMSGYITSLNMHDGMYAQPEMELLEIVNEEHLHLELDVFEKDVARLKDGLPITYTVPALGSQIYEGEVHVIGREFNVTNKTVRVHGHLEDEHPRFIKDLFIEAKIWLDDATVDALPEAAVIRSGADQFIFTSSDPKGAGEYHFEKHRVITGPSSEGYVSVQLIDPLPDDARIVTSGAYYVNAQALVEELGHSH